MSKELIISILTTLIGSILLSFLVFLGKSHPILATIAVFCLVTMIVLIINYQGKLLLMLRSPGKYDISGDWRTTWSYERPEGKVEMIVSFRVPQIGQYFRGVGKSIEIHGPAPFKNLRYEMRGEVHPDGIVQGKWTNLNVGMNYYGAFQAKVAHHGDEVEGVWVGFDSERVRAGTYSSKSERS